MFETNKKDTVMQIRLTKEEKQHLKIQARRLDLTVTQFIKEGIKSYLKESSKMEKKYFIEDFNFCEPDYEIKKFEGIKEMVSPKYGFNVIFKNSEDFRFKGSIDYEIEVPFTFLAEHTEITSQEDYDSEPDSINEFLDFMSDLRADIEEEIFDKLKEEGLAEEVDIDWYEGYDED